MSPRQLPGVYMILCLANNKRYYGESNNVSSIISQHKSRLRINIHEIPELQHDFNLYGEENFEFSAIYLSKDCTKNQRVALETEFIGRFYGLCYNKFDKTTIVLLDIRERCNDHPNRSRHKRVEMTRPPLSFTREGVRYGLILMVT